MPLAGPCKWSSGASNQDPAVADVVMSSQRKTRGTRACLACIESFFNPTSCSSLMQPGHLSAMQSAALHPRYPSSSTIHPNVSVGTAQFLHRARIRASAMQHICSPPRGSVLSPLMLASPLIAGQTAIRPSVRQPVKPGQPRPRPRPAGWITIRESTWTTGARLELCCSVRTVVVSRHLGASPGPGLVSANIPSFSPSPSPRPSSRLSLKLQQSSNKALFLCVSFLPKLPSYYHAPSSICAYSVSTCLPKQDALEPIATPNRCEQEALAGPNCLFEDRGRFEVWVARDDVAVISNPEVPR
ncbi:hypothetical protein CPAR01_05620 [Colletotrichum paranaense]|uniref:Uncharacterized protein n=1 Tax=Colletotrichum paranaense TaxID=1914294 RepID=A0ABQ9SRS3_9PEZI|nr:uncharacterized protein CPAR01_05620 [Colletotrichum paranaense]KAK1542233.1 hypothetical protein CPAR01_05620 [Colletotrichum paranaense]